MTNSRQPREWKCTWHRRTAMPTALMESVVAVAVATTALQKKSAAPKKKSAATKDHVSEWHFCYLLQHVTHANEKTQTILQCDFFLLLLMLSALHLSFFSSFLFFNFLCFAFFCVFFFSGQWISWFLFCSNGIILSFCSWQIDKFSFDLA